MPSLIAPRQLKYDDCFVINCNYGSLTVDQLNQFPLPVVTEPKLQIFFFGDPCVSTLMRSLNVYIFTFSHTKIKQYLRNKRVQSTNLCWLKRYDSANRIKFEILNYSIRRVSALTFTTFARDHPVVTARGLVTTHQAQVRRQRRSLVDGSTLQHNRSGVRRGRRTFDGQGYQHRDYVMPHFRRHAAGIGKKRWLNALDKPERH